MRAGWARDCHVACDYHVTQLRYVLEEKVLEVEIEPGMKDGYDYPFIAEGTFQISFLIN